MSTGKTMFRPAVLAAVLATLIGLLPYASDADARGFRRAGFFVGGVVVGAVLAPRYFYPAPYYYPPYPYPYPPVTYVAPPVVVQQPVTPVATQQAAPAPAPTQPMSIEDRLRRLRSMCEQGLFTEAECSSRREQILQEM